MTKVISIADDAYEALKNMKQPGDSFSDVVRRITEKTRKQSLKDFAGIWKGMPDIDKAFKDVKEQRKKGKVRDYVLP
jgi:predicted CopG family antitoxin